MPPKKGKNAAKPAASKGKAKTPRNQPPEPKVQESKTQLVSKPVMSYGNSETITVDDKVTIEAATPGGSIQQTTLPIVNASSKTESKTKADAKTPAVPSDKTKSAAAAAETKEKMKVMEEPKMQKKEEEMGPKDQANTQKTEVAQIGTPSIPPVATPIESVDKSNGDLVTNVQSALPPSSTLSSLVASIGGGSVIAEGLNVTFTGGVTLGPQYLIPFIRTVDSTFDFEMKWDQEGYPMLGGICEKYYNAFVGKTMSIFEIIIFVVEHITPYLLDLQANFIDNTDRIWKVGSISFRGYKPQVILSEQDITGDIKARLGITDDYPTKKTSEIQPDGTMKRYFPAALTEVFDTIQAYQTALLAGITRDPKEWKKFGFIRKGLSEFQFFSPSYFLQSIRVITKKCIARIRDGRNDLFIRFFTYVSQSSLIKHDLITSVKVNVGSEVLKLNIAANLSQTYGFQSIIGATTAASNLCLNQIRDLWFNKFVYGSSQIAFRTIPDEIAADAGESRALPQYTFIEFLSALYVIANAPTGSVTEQIFDELKAVFLSHVTTVLADNPNIRFSLTLLNQFKQANFMDEPWEKIGRTERKAYTSRYSENNGDRIIFFVWVILSPGRLKDVSFSSIYLDDIKRPIVDKLNYNGTRVYDDTPFINWVHMPYEQTNFTGSTWPLDVQVKNFGRYTDTKGFLRTFSMTYKMYVFLVLLEQWNLNGGMFDAGTSLRKTPCSSVTRALYRMITTSSANAAWHCISACLLGFSKSPFVIGNWRGSAALPPIIIPPARGASLMVAAVEPINVKDEPSDFMAAFYFSRELDVLISTGALLSILSDLPNPVDGKDMSKDIAFEFDTLSKWFLTLFDVIKGIMKFKPPEGFEITKMPDEPKTMPANVLQVADVFAVMRLRGEKATFMQTTAAELLGFCKELYEILNETGNFNVYSPPMSFMNMVANGANMRKELTSVIAYGPSRYTEVEEGRNIVFRPKLVNNVKPEKRLVDQFLNTFNAKTGKYAGSILPYRTNPKVFPFNKLQGIIPDVKIFEGDAFELASNIRALVLGETKIDNDSINVEKANQLKFIGPLKADTISSYVVIPTDYATRTYIIDRNFRTTSKTVYKQIGSFGEIMAPTTSRTIAISPTFN